VELSDLVILDRPHSAEGVSDGDYERRGYEVLVHGDGGPLMLQKREGGRLSLCLLFHTSRSTLPYRVGFPVMVSNLVQLAMEQAGLAEGAGSRTGVLRDLLVQPDRLYEVQGPDGPAAAAKSDANGILSGVPALRVGRYSVRTGGRVEASVGASLLAPAETVLASAEEIQFDEGLSVSAAGVMQTDRPLWSAFAMLAFGFLMGEWWYYHRRPGGQRP
jgi:hypothetical protein